MQEFPDSLPVIGNEFGLPSPEGEIIIDVLYIEEEAFNKFYSKIPKFLRPLSNNKIYNVDIIPISPLDSKKYYKDIIPNLYYTPPKPEKSKSIWGLPPKKIFGFINESLLTLSRITDSFKISEDAKFYWKTKNEFQDVCQYNPTGVA
jgi:hypothetical protein